MPQRLKPRYAALLVWLAAFIVSAAATGLPTKRGNVLIWVALAIIALGIDRPRSTARSLMTTWLPLFGALAAYDVLRGMSDGKQSDAHTWPHLDIDLWLGGGQSTPTVKLQEWLWTPGTPHIWDYAVWATYQSHFFVPLFTAVALWSMRHRLATPYIIGLAALSWMALATYFLYPAQPPWMTARDGLTPHVTRIVQHMWQDVGVDRAARVFTTKASAGSRYSNPVAALPSLHAAFPMFITIMLWGTRRWLNPLLVIYTLAMAFTLVYSGEHFTFDIALGWIYAAIVALAARSYHNLRPNTTKLPAGPQADFVGGAGMGRDTGGASRKR